MKSAFWAAGRVFWTCVSVLSVVVWVRRRRGGRARTNAPYLSPSATRFASSWAAIGEPFL
jgi:hypothetical protein